MSFVIERNGRQKACLVPLSVFLPNISPARIAHDLEQLEMAGEQSRTTITAEKEIAFKFLHSCDFGPYDITVLLPHNYPNTCPRVYVDPVDSSGASSVFGRRAMHLRCHEFMESWQAHGA